MLRGLMALVVLCGCGVQIDTPLPTPGSAGSRDAGVDAGLPDGNAPFISSSGTSEGVIWGVVLDVDTAEPLAEVMVEVGVRSVLTQADGRFELAHPVGIADVVATADGYLRRTKSVAVGPERFFTRVYMRRRSEPVVVSPLGAEVEAGELKLDFPAEVFAEDQALTVTSFGGHQLQALSAPVRYADNTGTREVLDVVVVEALRQPASSTITMRVPGPGQASRDSFSVRRWEDNGTWSDPRRAVRVDNGEMHFVLDELGTWAVFGPGAGYWVAGLSGTATIGSLGRAVSETDHLEEGTELRLGPTSTIELHDPSGAVFVLGPGSAVTLEPLEGDAGSVRAHGEHAITVMKPVLAERTPFAAHVLVGGAFFSLRLGVLTVRGFQCPEGNILHEGELSQGRTSLFIGGLVLEMLLQERLRVCEGCDGPPRCAATCEQSECGLACVDLESDSRHCGECDQPCAPGLICQGGRCAAEPCPLELSTCGQRCVDLQQNSAHCGACAAACSYGEECVDGVCELSCQDQCGGVCVSVSSDLAHCGQCEHACLGEQLCQAGECTGEICQPSESYCALVCVDLSSSPESCGQCDTSCAAGELCHQSECIGTCPEPLVACNGTCLDECPQL